jgi:hypothetical protein
MTLPDDANQVRRAAPGGAAPPQRDGDRGVLGNERLTALAGAALLVLIVAELVTVPTLHALLSAHVFVGVLLAGPLVVKTGSTAYRFARYYTRAPAYVRRGPPHLALRVMGPLLVATTFVLVGSGIGLMITGPAQPGPLLFLHGFSALLWFPLTAVHVVAHISPVPRLLVDEWRRPAAEQASGRRLRFGLNAVALMAGAISAILVLPTAPPWSAWIQSNERVPAPLVLGTLLAVLALLAARPLRWR